MIKEIALTLPGQTTPIATPKGFIFGTAAQPLTLVNIVTQAMTVVFFLATFLVFIYALYGIIQYILASGDKEKLAKARARITWAFVGFIFLIVSFALGQYIQQIFPTNATSNINVTAPNDLQPLAKPAAPAPAAPAAPVTQPDPALGQHLGNQAPPVDCSLTAEGCQ